MKKTLAQLYYGKPMEWVEYKTILYCAEPKGDKFLLSERVQLTSGAWASGREKLFDSMSEIDSLLLPKFVRDEEKSELVHSRDVVWYRLPKGDEN